MNNQGWSLNSLLAGLGVLTFALVFAVILYDAKIKEIGEKVGTKPKREEENYSYIEMEEELVRASEAYLKEEYGKHIPLGSLKITMEDLANSGFYDKIRDPKNRLQKCTGYVKIEVEEDHSSYYPYLKCGDNYESSVK